MTDTAQTSVVDFPLEQAELTIDHPEGAVIRRSVLPSGVRVLTEHVPGALSASVGFWVPVGSRDEDPVRFGSTHFLEHLLFKGTPRRSALDIAVAFDAVGGDNNAATAKEYTCYYAKVRDKDVPMAIETLADMVAASVIDPVEFENERQVILEELAMASDDPSDVVHESFAQLVYGTSPLARPIGGTNQTIGAVSRDEVLAHYRAHYGSSTLVVAAAGALAHDRVVELVVSALDAAGWDQSRASSPVPRRPTTPAPLGYEPRVRVTPKAVEQENIVVGVPGITATDDRRFTMSVLDAVLGGGMSSRLFQEVREKRGLAYSVYSFSGMYSDAGSFGMYAGCAPGKTAEVIRVMRDELLSVAADGITAEELRRAHGQLAGGMALSLDDTQARMSRLGRCEVGSGRFQSLDASIAAVESVTRNDVQRLAQELVAAPFSLSAVGPVVESKLAL